MTDTKKLASAVKKSTLPAAFLAEMMNTTEADYQKKAQGKKEFSVHDIAVLKKFLLLSDAEATEIFFPNSFKRFCKQKGITQRELCGLLNLKSVSKKLNGQQPFTLSQIKTICEHYHISADDYFL